MIMVNYKRFRDQCIHMDLHKVAGEGCHKWMVAGDMDRGSALMMESMLLNSQIGDDEVVLDMSGLNQISSEGLTSIHHICSKLKMQGGSLKLIGAQGDVANHIRPLGLVADGLIDEWCGNRLCQILEPIMQG